MKIFFSASLHGRSKYDENYTTIVNVIKSLGYQISADHILNYTTEDIRKFSEKELLEYNSKVVQGLKACDVFFAELSYTSTSVGYIIATAVQMGKPVVIFYSGDQEPNLFRTLEKTNDKLQIIRYSSLDDLKKEISQAIEFATTSQDTRFNFFISPSQSHYLDWIAKNKKVSRSVYLRNLINKDLEKRKS